MEGICTTESCFLIDNRIVPHFDFRTEATNAAFHCFLCDLVAKVVYLSQSYSWFHDPLGFAVAASPTTAKVVRLSVAQLNQLKNQILEQRFSVLGGNAAANCTWGEYLCDGLTKLINNIPQPPSLGQKRILITIYSTDLHLFGGMHSASILSGLKAFQRLLGYIKQTFALNTVKVRIVSILVHDTNTSVAPNENHALFYNEIIGQFGSFVEFLKLQVTGFDFEEELKVLLGECVPINFASFDLPPFLGQKFSLLLQLVPQSINSVTCISYFSNFEICSITDRIGINPLLLQGTPISVMAPTDEFAVKRLGNPLKVFQNKLMLETFISWASRKNYIFIARVPFTDKQQAQKNIVSQSKAPYCHYWALIPPMASTESQDGGVSSITGISSAHSTFEDITIYNRNKSLSSSCMVMVLLYDREQLLLPSLEQQTKYYQENMQKFVDDEKLFEMNTMLIAEMTKYLDTSIVPYFGNPVPYDPMNYVSGHLESKLSAFRPSTILQEAQSAPADVSSFATLSYAEMTVDKSESVKHVVQPVEHRQQGVKGGRGGGRTVGGRGRGSEKDTAESKLQLESLKTTRSAVSSTSQKNTISTEFRSNTMDDDDEEFDVSIADIFQDKKKKTKNSKRKLTSVFLDENKF